MIYTKQAYVHAQVNCEVDTISIVNRKRVIKYTHESSLSIERTRFNRQRAIKTSEVKPYYVRLRVRLRTGVRIYETGLINARTLMLLVLLLMWKLPI